MLLRGGEKNNNIGQLHLLKKDFVLFVSYRMLYSMLTTTIHFHSASLKIQNIVIINH